MLSYTVRCVHVHAFKGEGNALQRPGRLSPQATLKEKAASSALQLPSATMFMNEGDWSDDEDLGDDVVVPMGLPTPQLISAGSNHGSTADGSEGFGRATAYNERMARARNSMQTMRRANSGAPPTSTHSTAPPLS